jgi:hypothetical protein
MPVVHAEPQQANAGGSIRKRDFRMDCRAFQLKTALRAFARAMTKETTKEKTGAKRRRTQVELCRALRVRPLPHP